jgi:hypothetical protein
MRLRGLFSLIHRAFHICGDSLPGHSPGTLKLAAYGLSAEFPLSWSVEKVTAVDRTLWIVVHNDQPRLSRLWRNVSR